MSTTETTPTRSTRRSQIVALYGLIMRTSVRPTRVAALGALGALGVLVAVLITVQEIDDPSETAAQFANGFGLSLLVPIAALVMGSAALGDQNEDRTLVYVWLRPVARWRIAAAALAATMSVVVPVTAVPLGLVALIIAPGEPILVTAVTLAVSVIAVSYSAVFVALGARLRRPLLWGLLYIVIWEGFVATAEGGFGRLALRSYSRSIVANLAEVDLPLATQSTVVAIVVPLLVALVASMYTVLRLHRQDVA